MPAELRQLRLRYAAVCAVCSRALAPGSDAWWDATRKQAQCMEHAPPAEQPEVSTSDLEMDRELAINPYESEEARADFLRVIEEEAARQLPTEAEIDVVSGVAGASAQREFERRRAKRQERIRADHPHIGGLILALTDTPQSTRAWATGADGERELGKRFDEMAARGAIALHDRRIPGTRANIDHIVVAPAGVFVVDAKKYAGKVEKRDVGGFFKKDERLYVGRRDCSKLLEGMHKQVAVVRDALSAHTEVADIPVTGTLCFVGAEWSLFARPIHLEDVTVTWPKALVETFEKQDALSAERITLVARMLGERLPPA